MILPERVFGRLSANRMSSGLAMATHHAPRLQLRNYCTQLAGITRRARPPRHTTKANTASPLIVVLLADHGSLRHPRMATSADSISIVPNRCPATFSTSSMRPMIQK